METKNREVEINLKFCVQCGKKNDSESRFCIYCGHPFSENDISKNVEEGRSNSSNIESLQNRKLRISDERHKITLKKVLIVWIIFNIILAAMAMLYGSGENVKKQIESGKEKLMQEIEGELRKSGIDLKEIDEGDS